MKLSQFRFDLPLNLIAQQPTKKREDSRMMVIHRKTGQIENRHFKDIIDYFNDKDVFVVNNTKVFPARMYGRKEKTGAKIEVFLLRELNKANRLWDVIVDPARKIRVGNKLYFGESDELVAEVIDNTTSRGRTIRFLWDGTDEEFRMMLETLGETPLPKYIKRKPEAEDKERYQTVYAKHEGAVAAPTAGLHFSEELIKRLEIKGIRFAETTLHTGLGTFRPIEVEDLSKHKMDAEYYRIEEAACRIVNKAKEGGHRICSIGTTTMRSMESSFTAQKLLKPSEGWTNHFIHPPYNFNIADSLVTNFHLPKTSLLIMACAFAGYDLMMEAYKKAIKDKYRFFSYGDAMLII
ncbi:MAG TPA: tRNA preQ1(34) S-adenosylmethionine ribosyltransferase-isomerase QueA [Ferruginibacter sp.]|jgi:S-adenosylmethionine:tRNA ribosyltransferase-isomerase|nr:tRNA preQ1(34) S-adenosylmethionine ribosyltransferase-isomerase QueA [Ferruginibacter sp.]MBN8700489.1 tRNA preQ1(34) S-adenosylmethionine ribosyltransferase-isomerase QueA [Chitinophagales bacterium]HMU71347.1 tRNA preQ1(34) S-adenosylmethionine ribosyltransferase-isomerase QueA [Ferruginibacter sp.]HMW25834.1 tRNA preQ1(34) S-adenosylmethionine ribosyltransferase-isomerase QueA [Ferruginibacter sp.]HMX81598.1 tRNA preQ1(34) S-adenosylmethionine ribosyltransferase-isomerase QueA [Ferrugini